ncbi:hypothetical protein [Streptomyces phaeofaciens]|uniref:hypothetical protein n=1 Tax=Streptomyces phaeofaciens TaxID=68254 RepID=UPI0036CD315B
MGRWAGDVLLIADSRPCTGQGRRERVVEPDADGRYRIGGLWRWREWPVDEDDSDG